MNARTVKRVLGVAALAVSVFLWMDWMSGGEAPVPAGGEAQGPTPSEATVWTCSMHPQIRADAPGSCPLCGMDLEPVQVGPQDGTVRLSEGDRAGAGIEVAPIGRRALEREVRAVGRVEVVEGAYVHVAARIPARVERVHVAAVGEAVARGAPLADLYSPELVLAQAELQIADRHLRSLPAGSPDGEASRSAFDAARTKLLLWGVTGEQVERLRVLAAPETVLPFLSPAAGTVMEKSVREGMYVEAGQDLFVLADLSTVWVVADLFEPDLPWVFEGMRGSIEAAGAPGEAFEGTVERVEPEVSDETRAVRVRLAVPNGRGVLKPGMYATVHLRARLGPDGRRAGEGPARTVHVCPMNCQPPVETLGRCAVCGMALVEERITPDAEVVAVPATAVLTTGTRSIAYKELEPGRYQAVALVLGPRAGDFYPVVAGLSEGDRVVVHGNFLLDSQAQLEGGPSLLVPGEKDGE
ncbi:MAG: efflux RND transporter periplasmic adaptor subunit [Planctomycetes bacterium]|nr:efflux RND transporter periplasmic adaptor subunit [Planctomycetota bacterium]